MSNDKPKRRPLTPAELLARHDAPRREAEKRAELTNEVRAWREAETRILEDLRAVDVVIDSIWDLVAASESYPNAIPVLLVHLERGGYPDQVTEAMGRALAVRRAQPFWDRLVALYASPRTAAERTGVLVALTTIANADRVDSMIDIVNDPEYGSTRRQFLRPILEHGGRKGRRFVESLLQHPVLGPEAATQLRNKPLRG